MARVLAAATASPRRQLRNGGPVDLCTTVISFPSVCSEAAEYRRNQRGCNSRASLPGQLRYPARYSAATRWRLEACDVPGPPTRTVICRRAAWPALLIHLCSIAPDLSHPETSRVGEAPRCRHGELPIDSSEWA